MEVILAKHAGFCFGVKRATHLAFDAADKGGDTCTLGPIIHSPQVVQRLEEMGVKSVEDVAEIKSGSTVIIRSHGVAAEELEAVVRADLAIVDATCPFVKKAQEHVATLSREGYDVVVVGDAVHPEVQGIVSYATGRVYVVSSGKDVERLPRMAKMGVVAQTTQSFEHLNEVVAACLARGGETRVYNTICDATAVRQEEAKKLASEVDCMIVIGGFNSANTKRLAQICREFLPRTHHIETAGQIDPAWFDGVQRVGVTAGASTPKWLIDEVTERISAIDKDKIG
ncbi:4-hydroxy-3-methylbut-2-enyl diphosphate reductase [Geomonas azotofigens]|uniref:4-hydroxy-3-methylbut-2-enyl diphosphate reductase n=1 Tax=Geomonas azotofigens TaxID=2843196 RepID=UPI001C1264DA|nr:4-hydroxy-3-methylbut-2-enyl diphosphate reductase [Geomonas azotofigens]MBU5615035.1 4-hydroxy-3-methylbut-2-enyl diphosphate reductase [Geomonas azotofigens]